MAYNCNCCKIVGEVVTSYGDTDLDWHWFRWWLVAWQQEAITWTNTDLLSKVFSGIHLSAHFWRSHKFSKLLPQFPGANGFIHYSTHTKFNASLMIGLVNHINGAYDLIPQSLVRLIFCFVLSGSGIILCMHPANGRRRYNVILEYRQNFCNSQALVNH